MSGTMDKLSTKNPLTKQLPPHLQTKRKQTKTIQDSKILHIQIQDLEARYTQVVNDMNRLTASIREYDERNGTNTFDSERPFNHEGTRLKLAYWALVEQEKGLSAFLISKQEQVQKETAEHKKNGYRAASSQSLGPVAVDNSKPSRYKPPHLIQLEKAKIQLATKKEELIMLRYAYAQAGKAIDEMATKAKEEDGQDRTDSLNFKDGPPVRDQVQHAEQKQVYRSSVEKQQKMYDVLMEEEIGFLNALIDYEQGIYRHYEKEFAELKVEIRELREDCRIESREHEDNLRRFQNKSLLLFMLLSIATFFISLSQLVTWALDNVFKNDHQ